MSSLSYARAGISFLLGPVMGFYNDPQQDQEIAVLRIETDTILQDLGDLRDPTEEQLKIYKKGRVYATCEMGGTLLATAAVASLIAFGILSTSPLNIALSCILGLRTIERLFKIYTIQNTIHSTEAADIYP